MKYKIDWLAFTINFKHRKQPQTFDRGIFRVLKLDLNEFEEAPAKYFYNAGATFNGYVNVYWNDEEIPAHENSSNTMTVQITGQGCTDLAERFDNDFLAIFKAIREYDETIKYTRIDIALDDSKETIPLSKIENKLRRGHYRSVKRTYNIVKTSNQNRENKAMTIYIGNHRADNGSRGNVYLRIYDRKALCESKNILPPPEFRDSWIRYEIAYSKKYANKVVNEFLAGKTVEEIFKTSLRQLLELLIPSKTDTNKARWKVVKYWEDFLKISDKFDFSIAERDMTIAETLEWIRVSVLPSLALLEAIGDEKGFDIYHLLEKAEKPKPAEFSKKQKRMLTKSKTLNSGTFLKYLNNFEKGKNVNE